MKKTAYGTIACVVVNILIAGRTAMGTSQPAAFADWPAGASPLEVGKKLSNHMLPLWRITRP